MDTNIFLQEYSIQEVKYSQYQAEYKLPFDVRARWDTSKPDIKSLLEQPGLEVIAYHEDTVSDSHAILYTINDMIVLGVIEKKNTSWNVTGKNKMLINEHLESLKQYLKPRTDIQDGKIKIQFWYITNQGPVSVRRVIDVPNWNQIKANYHKETYEGLEYLMNEFKPSGGGQLLIMHGVPGTGKSFFLRALINKWKSWCTPEYILDPEQLFSGGSGYLANLVLNSSVDEYDEPEADDNGKWKLLILEDSGELLKPDAANYAGHGGIARLLNLVDGLIGQGLRVLVLITTNEEITHLHPAVSREGRTAASIKFEPLTRPEATEWIGDAPLTLPSGDSFTLSDLYALNRNKKLRARKFEKKSTKSFGFVIQ